MLSEAALSFRAAKLWSVSWRHHVPRAMALQAVVRSLWLQVTETGSIFLKQKKKKKKRN